MRLKSNHHTKVNSQKQIFFLHSGGAQGQSEGSGPFIAWLEKQLEPEYEILHPIMPHPEAPDYQTWKPELKKAFLKLHDDAMLVGHSLGGSLLLKYLAEEKIELSIAGLFIISAPMWGGDENWQYDAFELPDDFSRTLPKIPKIFLYHSFDDPIVSFTHQAMYASKLPSAKVRQITGDEHVFSNGLPELIEDIRGLIKEN